MRTVYASKRSSLDLLKYAEDQALWKSMVINVMTNSDVQTEYFAKFSSF